MTGEPEPIQQVIFSEEDVRLIEREMRAQITNDGSYSDSLAHRMLAMIATLRTVSESAVCYRCVERQQELTAALSEVEAMKAEHVILASMMDEARIEIERFRKLEHRFLQGIYGDAALDGAEG